MFASRIQHPLIKQLEKHLFSYSGVVDLPGHKGVEVRVKGRSSRSLKFAIAELEFLRENLASVVLPATDDFHTSYQAIEHAVQDEGFRLKEEGGSLPKLSAPSDVWLNVRLERIDIQPSGPLPVRLSFRAPWEVEHDLGIYLKDREFQYAGVSV